MKALVTGAAGFIGSHLVEALIKRGYDVTCLVRKTSNLNWIENLDIKYVYCDLACPETYYDKIDNYDYIYHLAGLTKALSEKEFFQANSENTKKLLQALADRNSGVRRFIFLSSLAATGPSRNGKPVTEDSPSMPVSVYGKSKLEGEKAVMKYRDKMPVTVLRPPAIYGPRDKDFFFLFKALQKGIFPYWGKCYYSLLYVEDLVQGIILSAESRGGEDKTFFLSDGMFYTNEDIANEICAALDSRVVKIRFPRSVMPFLAFIGQKINKKGIINTDRIKDFAFSNWTCDSSKAKEELGFDTRITLREGIKWTADWYRIHQWL
ncbi:MAG: NAD(P)-dependent oxidoreductase [Nitrospirota bacterium]